MPPRIFGDDIFISYSRKDGALYSTGLADDLTQKKYSCFLDKLGTEPDSDLPPSLKRKIRSCTVCVVVGTEKAAVSEFVEKEIAEFRKTKRSILLINFAGAIGRAHWYPLIVGLATEEEKNLDSLNTGDPSANVISYIEKSFRYTKRNQRMSRTLWTSLSLFVLLITTSLVAGFIARDQVVKASQAKALADEQTRKAIDATKLADQKTEEAGGAARLAEDASRLAKEKTDEANKQSLLAQSAAREAERQQQIAAQQKSLAKNLAVMSRKLSYSTNLNVANTAFERAEIAQMLFALDYVKPAPGTEDLRGFEWYYDWKRANNHALSINAEQGNLVAGGFSREGNEIATAGSRDSITIWDAVTGEKLTTQPGHKLGVLDGVGAMAVSPTGNVFATSGDGDSQVKIWDFKTGRAINTYNLRRTNDRQGAFAYQMAFSPDGKSLAVLIQPDQRNPASGLSTLMYIPHYVKFLDVNTGEETYKIDADDPRAIAFAPDGKTFAAGSGKDVTLWDLEKGQPIKTSTLERGWVRRMAFSPDRKTLAVAGDDIILLDAVQLSEKALMRGHTDFISSLAYSPDGKLLVSASKDRTARVWDTANYKTLAVLKGHIEELSSVTFSADGKRLLTTGLEGTAKVWSLDRHLSTADSTGNSSVVSPDGRTLVTWERSYGRVVVNGNDQIVKIIDLATWKEFLTLRIGNGGNDEVGFSPDSRFLVIAGSEPTLLDLNTLQTRLFKRVSLGQHGKAFFSDDSRNLFVVSEKNELRRFDVLTGQEAVPSRLFKTDKRLPDFARSVYIAPNHELVAFADAGRIRVFNLKKMSEQAEFNDREKWLDKVQFSPDGKLICALNGKNHLTIWNTATKSEVLKLDGFKSEAFNLLTFSQDSKTLALKTKPNQVDVITLKDNQTLFTLTGHRSDITAVAFSNDGKRIATGSDDHSIKVWDASNGQELITLESDLGPVLSINFSPDDRTLITGHFNDEIRQIKFWHGAADRELVNERLSPQVRKAVRDSVLASSQNKTNPMALNLELQSDPNSIPRDSVKELIADELEAFGRELAQDGKLNEAIIAFNGALRFSPKRKLKPEVDVKRIYFTVLLPNVEKGVDQYRQTRELEPTPENCRNLIAGFTKAIDLMTPAAEKGMPAPPELEAAYLSRGLCYFTVNDIDAATVDWKSAVKVNPESWAGYSNLGFVHFEKNQFDDAIKAWTTSVQLKPDNDEGWGGLGITLLEIGKTEEAIAAYTKAVEINKDFLSPDWLRKNRGWSEKTIVTVTKLISLLRLK